MKSGLIRVAAAVPEVAVGNVRKNREHIVRMLREAEDIGASIVAFPELSLTSYTLGDLFRQHHLLELSEQQLGLLLEETKDLKALAIVGMPVASADKLYNTAVVFQSGRVLGVVPKIYIPNYSEYYEERWFASGAQLSEKTVELAGQTAPFGSDLLFECEQVRELVLGVELCEDLWVPFPPHAYQATSGATLIVNISASNELAGKGEYREQMIRQQSGRFVCGYVYVSAGPGESTTDTVFGGHAVMAENGSLLESSPRFLFDAHMSVTEFDLHRLLHDRKLRNTFVAEGPGRPYRRVRFSAAEAEPRFRQIDRMPFVPGGREERDVRCREVFDI